MSRRLPASRRTRWLLLLVSLLPSLADAAPAWFRVNIFFAPPQAQRAERRPIINVAAVTALSEQQCAVADGAGSPLGETAWLRGSLRLTLPAAARRLHAAAQLAQEVPAAARLLAPELAHQDPDRAYAAALTLVFVAAKSDPAFGEPVTTASLDRAVSLATQAGRSCSDCAYLRAVSAWQQGRPTEALTQLDRALAQDKRYFNALALRLLLLTERLQSTATRPDSECIRSLAGLVDTLIELGKINPCPLQAGHLDLLISRHFEHPDEHASIWAMRLVLGSITRNESVRAASYRALTRATDLPGRCQRRLLEDAGRLIDSGSAPRRDLARHGDAGL